MAESVAKNGGFYIGRYETSLTNATSTSEGTGIAQCRAGVIPINANNICANTWYGLYKIQKLYNINSNSIQSSMIWGSQYDAMINWVKNGNGLDKSKVTDTTIGNHNGTSIVTTGNESYSNDSINNIRDLGGNLCEGTLESYGDNRIIRGGYWPYNNKSAPASRTSDIPTRADSSVGSRMTLYLS